MEITASSRNNTRDILAMVIMGTGGSGGLDKITKNMLTIPEYSRVCVRAHRKVQNYCSSCVDVFDASELGSA